MLAIIGVPTFIWNFREPLINLVSMYISGPNAPKCLDFKRSQRSACRSARHGGDSSNLELFNEITHFVDASTIYGSSEK